MPSRLIVAALAIFLSLLDTPLRGAALPSALARECRPAGDQVWDCRRDSAALGREESYTLVVPRRAKPPSLILLLHGSGRTHRTLVENAKTAVALKASESVIVMPYGRASWWLNEYRSFALEIASTVAASFGISRERRACSGWSMGAFGSVRLVQENPQAFAAWGGLLGLLDFPNPAYPPPQNHSVPPAFGDPERWPAENPLQHATALRGKKIWFRSATEAFDLQMNEAFHGELTRLGIPHEYQAGPGGHTFVVVAQTLQPMLRFLDTALHEVRHD